MSDISVCSICGKMIVKTKDGWVYPCNHAPLENNFTARVAPEQQNLTACRDLL